MAGDTDGERAGRRRVAGAHNLLCRVVQTVRAEARAAHRVAGAGPAAIETAAHSFQRNMQVHQEG